MQKNIYLYLSLSSLCLSPLLPLHFVPRLKLDDGEDTGLDFSLIGLEWDSAIALHGQTVVTDLYQPVWTWGKGQAESFT